MKNEFPPIVIICVVSFNCFFQLYDIYICTHFDIYACPIYKIKTKNDASKNQKLKMKSSVYYKILMKSLAYYSAAVDYNNNNNNN